MTCSFLVRRGAAREKLVGDMRASFLLALAACGGGGGPTDTLDLQLVDTALAVVRTGDAWTPITVSPGGDASIEVDGPTTLVTVCDTAERFNFYTLLVGPGMDDAEPLTIDCSVSTGTVAVTVAAPRTTRVYAGSHSSSGGGPLVLPPGTYDVVALDVTATPPRFELRRDVTIAADTTLAFDLAATGTPLREARVDVTGAATGEAPSPDTILSTANRTHAPVFGTGAMTWLFPAAALQPGDRQVVSVGTVSDALGTRGATSRVDGSETVVALALPDYLEAVTATATSVAWPGGSRWNDLYYGITSPDFRVLWDVRVFPAWIATGGAVDTIAFADPTDIPGWQRAWNLGVTTGFAWQFFAIEDTGEIAYHATRAGTL